MARKSEPLKVTVATPVTDEMRLRWMDKLAELLAARDGLEAHRIERKEAGA